MIIRTTRVVLNLSWITLVILFLFGGMVSAKEVKEHPLIRPFPGSVLAKNMSKYRSYDAFDFYHMNEQTKKREKKKVKGKYYKLLYEVRTPAGERVKDISNLEFLENYKAAAVEKGGKIVYEDRGQIVFTIPREDGGITWCKVSLNAGLGQQYLVIVDEKAFEKSMIFGPKKLKAALDRDGKILLYGILFDLDKADLKPESVKQLQHIVSLMVSYPELRLEIQGHTDNQGPDDYNMDLSRKRAQTVYTYLTLFGVGKDRLSAAGYGETRPVATNDTKEGRGKNRRVELVKMAAVPVSTKETPRAHPAKETPAAGSNQDSSTKAASETIEGTWEMAPNKRVKEGRIVFKDNGTYLMTEFLQDGKVRFQRKENTQSIVKSLLHELICV